MPRRCLYHSTTCTRLRPSHGGKILLTEGLQWLLKAEEPYILITNQPDTGQPTRQVRSCSIPTAGPQHSKSFAFYDPLLDSFHVTTMLLPNCNLVHLNSTLSAIFHRYLNIYNIHVGLHLGCGIFFPDECPFAPANYRIVFFDILPFEANNNATQTWSLIEDVGQVTV